MLATVFSSNHDIPLRLNIPKPDLSRQLLTATTTLPRSQMRDGVRWEAIWFMVTLPHIQARDGGTVSSSRLGSHSPLRVRKWGWPRPPQLTLAPNCELHNPWKGWGVSLGSFWGNCARR
jgi:hypothetical protein